MTVQNLGMDVFVLFDCAREQAYSRSRGHRVNRVKLTDCPDHVIRRNRGMCSTTDSHSPVESRITKLTVRLGQAQKLALAIWNHANDCQQRAKEI